MNKDIKKAKEQALKVKYKNKEELAKSKAALAKSLKELKVQIKNARLEEKKLKLKLAKEVTEEKNREAKEKKELQLAIKQEKRVILENKKTIELEKQKIKQEISLEKAKQKNELIKTKTANAQKIANLKSQFAFEKNKHQKELMSVRVEANQKLIKTKEDIEKARIEAIKFKLEQEKVIQARREELFDKKKDYATRVTDLRSKAAKDRAVRLEEKLKVQQELKAKEQEALLKHKMKVLELKGETVKANELALTASTKLENEIVGAKVALQETKQAKAKQDLELKVIDLNNKEAIAESQAQTQVKVKPVASEKYVSGVTVEVDTTEFNPEINDEILKGKIIDEVGKAGMKLYERANRDDTKLVLSKLRLSEKVLDGISLFQDLKTKKDLIDIREFAKYISYLIDKEVPRSEVEKYVISTLAWLLRGKILSFLGGYFHVVKVKGMTLIIFEEKITGRNHQIISLPNSEFTSTLEKMMLEKLNRGGVIQIANNVALKVEEGTINVLCDLPLLEM